ncbi:MAG: hypothetical protein NZ740_10320 [Kiritimatiellae bacterium]|nr:hypothetical protein [Kiritimatiellia bacterium]MDW8459483.1 hypothetical protein [Verrucomicrobiota bacterium]
MPINYFLSYLASKCGYVIKRRHPAGLRANRSTNLSQPVTRNVLMQRIHGQDIYEGFDFEAYAFDPTGWGSDSAAFAKILGRYRLRFVV